MMSDTDWALKLEDCRIECGKLRAGNKRLREGLGWFYAKACTMADAGEDIRQAEFPALIAEMDRDLSE